MTSATNGVAEFTVWDRESALVPGTNTMIGAVLTDATLTNEQTNRIATVAHDGVARAIGPSHTMYDEIHAGDRGALRVV